MLSRIEGFHGTLIENVVKQLDKLHPKGTYRRFQKSTYSFQGHYRSCGRKSRREQHLKKEKSNEEVEEDDEGEGEDEDEDGDMRKIIYDFFHQIDDIPEGSQLTT